MAGSHLQKMLNTLTLKGLDIKPMHDRFTACLKNKQQLSPVGTNLLIRVSVNTEWPLFPGYHRRLLQIPALCPAVAVRSRVSSPIDYRS
jgi:hypothetical protein